MSGTIAGGRKAAVTNKSRYNKDFYKRIGAVGGSAKVPKGFALDRDLAARAGRIGGQISRRGKSANTIFREQIAEGKAGAIYTLGVDHGFKPKKHWWDK